MDKLITILPELIYMFLPGFIFMCIYMRINTKHLNIYVISLWSLFISSLISTIYSVIHSFLFVSHDFNEYVKILIYVITGAILPFIITVIGKSRFIGWILLKTNYQTIHSDILDDVIDYQKKTMMTVFLRNSDFYYIGTFILKEENGKDSRIALIDYALMNKYNNAVICKPIYNSSVVIGLSDIERIELTYDNKSKVWKRLVKEQEN